VALPTAFCGLFSQIATSMIACSATAASYSLLRSRVFVILFVPHVPMSIVCDILH